MNDSRDRSRSAVHGTPVNRQLPSCRARWYSGWHTHPGLLIGVVRSGQIDFFDADCRKRTVGPGEVYTENADVHGIINNGFEDAELYISYLIKHGAPRRLDAPAPDCAGETGIP